MECHILHTFVGGEEFYGSRLKVSGWMAGRGNSAWRGRGLRLPLFLAPATLEQAKLLAFRTDWPCDHTWAGAGRAHQCCRCLSLRYLRVTPDA